MSQTDGKWIKNDTIKDNHIRLRNNLPLRARNFADSADLEFMKFDAADDLQFLQKPVYDDAIEAISGGKDLVNVDYLNAAVAGQRDPKDACKLATDAALPAYANVAGVLTASANGAIPNIDSVAPIVGDRILFLNGAAGADNGIYDVTDLGSAGTPWILTRSADADNIISGSEVTNGMATMITAGSVNSKRLYLLTTADPIVINTTALAFAQIPNPATFQTMVKLEKTLSDGEEAAGFITLANLADAQSVQIYVEGGGLQKETQDYVLSTVGGVTQIDWANALAAAGAQELLGPTNGALAPQGAADSIIVYYEKETI